MGTSVADVGQGGAVYGRKPAQASPGRAIHSCGLWAYACTIGLMSRALPQASHPHPHRPP
jgi:hypothetical protein